MQTVYVLRNDASEFSQLFESRKLFVDYVWFCPRNKHFVAVKLKKFLGVSHEKVMAQNILWRVLVLLVVQSVGRTKIGNVTFGRYTRSAEKNYVV